MGREYSKSIIYMLKCRIPRFEKVYIGGTINIKNSLHQHTRHAKHKDSSRWNAELYNYIRETGGIMNWTIEQLIEYPCNSVKELNKEVLYWRNKNNNIPQLDDGLKTTDLANYPTKTKRFDKLKLIPTVYEPKVEEKQLNNWYKLNRHKLMERVPCDNCDLKIARTNMKQHKKTKRCLNFL